MRWGLGALVLLATACSEGPLRASQERPGPRGTPAELVSVELPGGREERVACVFACDDVRRSLLELRRRCVDDPRSAPRTVDLEPRLVAFGCCSDAVSTYRAACGIEALESCVSRWIAECESGRLTP